MMTTRSLLLFVLAAVAEIGGAWLIWQGWREHRGILWIIGGVLALGAYGFAASLHRTLILGVSWQLMAAFLLLVHSRGE